jgi:transposase
VIIYIVMHIVENKSKQGKKIYQSVLLRESYRENGKVKKRTIANLSNCSAEEISAIKLALQYKGDLSKLVHIENDVNLQEGFSVGAVWVVYQIAKRVGIEGALGKEISGKLALWQVIARVIDQGSRLSAVRLAQVHAACDILGIDRGFNEDSLYENLAWMAVNQEGVESRLFSGRRGKESAEIFLYDVTSSYLEGEENFFGEYGYNRDGKKGKKQIVIGLLCDEYGDPVSVEVFSGNVQDPKTFAPQVSKIAERFGCWRVTFVGDRGMIKSAQIEQLPEGFHYITAITKPQIRSLMQQGVIQLDLFDKDICEVEDDGVRYILRRNPIRAEELDKSRLSKRRKIEQLTEQKNLYLKEHLRAKVDTGIKEITKKIGQLKVDKWLRVQSKGRVLTLEADEECLKKESDLDGCYAIKTDLPKSAADKQIIHDRYKDLTLVEKVFRNCKTTFLEVRPVFVRTEKSTRGHVLTVMLAYMIVRYLQKAWNEFNLTVEEGLKQLSTLTSMEMKVKNEQSILKIPKPREQSENLLKALNIKMPTILPHKEVTVVTKKKLQKQRKAL